MQPMIAIIADFGGNFLVAVGQDISPLMRTKTRIVTTFAARRMVEG
ncbi:MAG: hypothetical protein AB1479_10070 [Pseudomonadota bacterium]